MRRWTLYGLVGVGRIYYKPSLQYLRTENGHVANTEITSETWSAGKTLAQEDRNKTLGDWAVPFGGGLKYRVSDRVDIGLEGQYWTVANDKLDGYREYTNDQFFYANALMSFKFGPKRIAMEWVNPLDLLGNEIDSVRILMRGIGVDTDGDGVADNFDKDGNTPAGTKVYGDGTSVDTDMDGVPDSRDNDPYSTKGARVDANGVEMDDDGDGVPNSRDLEPGTPAGTLVNFQGKTINRTREEVRTMDNMAWLPSVYFATGSANIEYKYYENIATVARALKANPDIKLTIVGNADITGKKAANEKLARRRAQAIEDQLAKSYGISRSRLGIDVRGDNTPLSADINAVNRRVDFIVR